MKRSGSTFSQTIIKSILFGARNAKKSQVAKQHNAKMRKNAASDLFGVQGKKHPSAKSISKILVPMNCSLHSSALRPCLLGLLCVSLAALAYVSAYAVTSGSANHESSNNSTDYGISPIDLPDEHVAGDGSSMTLTIPESIKLDINPTSSSFAKSEDFTLSAKTTTSLGYTLSINAKDSTNGNNLVNGSSKINSISQSLSEDNFRTSANVNTWGYRPSKFNSKDNTDFQPGPTTSSTVLNKTTAANSASDEYKIALAAKVDNNITAGAYNNSFTFTLTTNGRSYSIYYDLSSTSASGGPSPNPQVGITTDNVIKLDSKTPSHSSYNYTFNGWCDKPVSQGLSCSGTTYQAGSDYPLTGDSVNVTLYAIWRYYNPCFLADTLVDTPNGLKAIQNLKEGDIVYSYDLDTKELKTDIVTRTYESVGDEILKLTLDDGSIIQGTEYHPFYDWTEDDWDPLISFQTNSIITTTNGIRHISRSLERLTGQRTKYNLSTEKYYNYIIATSKEDKFLVLSVPPDDIYQDLVRKNPDIISPLPMPLVGGTR